QGEDGAENRTDTGGPGEGEGHTHEGGRPGPEGGGPELEPAVLIDPAHRADGGPGPEPGRERPHQQDQPHDQDDNAGDRGEDLLVGVEGLPEPGGGGAEGDEDDGEPGDEEADAPEQRPQRAGPA